MVPNPVRLWNIAELDSKASKNTIFSIYGIVKFKKPSSICANGNSYMLISIIDDTCPTGSTLKLMVQCYCKSEIYLPKVEIGDIVRISKLMLIEPNVSDIPVAIYNQFSNCDVIQFERGCGEQIPLTSSIANYTYIDEETIKRLVKYKYSGVCNLEEEHITLFSNFNDSGYFNVIVMVLAVGESIEDQAIILRVSDGTFLDRSVLVADVDEFKYIQSQDILERLRNMTFDIYVYDEHRTVAKTILPGDFAKIINLHCSSFIQGRINPPHYKCGTLSEIPNVHLIVHGGNSYGRSIAKTESNIVENRIMSLMNTRDENLSQSQNDWVKTCQNSQRKYQLKILLKNSQMMPYSVSKTFIESQENTIHKIKCKFLNFQDSKAIENKKFRKRAIFFLIELENSAKDILVLPEENFKQFFELYKNEMEDQKISTILSNIITSNYNFIDTLVMIVKNGNKRINLMTAMCIE